MFAWISNLLSAIGSVFSWMGKRSDLNNTPEMKRADAAQKSVKEQDRIHDEIKRGDLGKIRNDLSP